MLEHKVKIGKCDTHSLYFVVTHPESDPVFLFRIKHIVFSDFS